MKVNRKLCLFSLLLSFNSYAVDDCKKIPELNLRNATTPYWIDIPVDVYASYTHAEAIWNLMCFTKLNLPKNHCIEIGFLPERVVDNSSKLIGAVYSLYTRNPEQYVDTKKGQDIIHLCKCSTNDLLVKELTKTPDCIKSVDITNIVGDLQAYTANFNAQTPNIGLTRNSRQGSRASTLNSGGGITLYLLFCRSIYSQRLLS